MGKSLVASLLRTRKVPVFDSDRAVHNLMEPRGPAFKKIAATFPNVIDQKTGRINRAELGRTVFSNSIERKKLEMILHPLVDDAQKKFILKCRRMGMKTAALDIPLLFETRGEKKCDRVMVVTAPAFLQKLRVLRRPHMTEEKYYQILARQMPDIQKRRLADHTIQTGLGRRFSMQQILRMLAQIKTGKL